MNEYNYDKLNESQIIEPTELYQEINELLSKFNRYNQLPEDKQKKVLNIFVEEIQKVEHEEQIRIAKETCEKEGHIYSGEYEGWKDNSYHIIWNSPTRHIRLVNSLIGIYSKDSIHIEWTRICTRCGKLEKIHKIPDIVHETEKLKNRKKSKGK